MQLGDFMRLSVVQLLVPLYQTFEHADLFSNFLGLPELASEDCVLLAALALVLGDLGGAVVGLGRLRTLQDVRIVVIALVLVFAHTDNLGHLQYVEDVVRAPHLSLLAARIEELVDLADDLITIDSWVRLDVLDREDGQLRDLSVVRRLNRATIYLMHLGLEALHGPLRLSSHVLSHLRLIVQHVRV